MDGAIWGRGKRKKEIGEAEGPEARKIPARQIAAMWLKIGTRLMPETSVSGREGLELVSTAV
jgi:hypothetical protein